MFTYFHLAKPSRGPGAPAVTLPLTSVYSRVPQGQSISVQCILCYSVLSSIYSNFNFERALNNSNFKIRLNGSVFPCTRSMKSNPKKNPTGVGVRSDHVLFLQKCCVFTVNTADTAAEPSRWLAASPCWLIPLINRFTETYRRRSTRLLPELIVGVKERVSKF